MKTYQYVSIICAVTSLTFGSTPKNSISTGASGYSGGTMTVYGNYDHQVGCGVWGFGLGVEGASNSFADYNSILVSPRISLHPVSLISDSSKIEKLGLALIFQPIGFGAIEKNEWKYLHGTPSLSVAVNYRLGKAFALSSEIGMASRPETEIEYTIRSSFGVSWIF